MIPATATPSEAGAPTSDPRSPVHARWPVLLALAVAVAHFIWIVSHLSPAIMSPDANGYMVQARLIATEGRTSFKAESPAQFIGMHWLESAPGVFHSRYPAGLPLLQAAAWKIAGLRGALLVNPLLASATLFLVFCLARRCVSGGFAVLAAVIVAAVPAANQHAVDADAHIAASFFLVGGVLALLRFEETRSPAAGLLAGGLLGAVPAMRYPEAIAGVAIGAWLLWRVRPVRRIWPAVVGAALPVSLLCAHNAAAYGAFWKTGYALTNEQTGFGPGYFATHVIPYLLALSGPGLGLMFAFGAAGIAALAADPRHRRCGLLFAGLTVPLILLYMAYYFSGPGGGGAVTGNLRFLIPTFGFFAVGAVWLLALIAERLGRAGRIAVGVVVALQLIMAIGSSGPVLRQFSSSLATAARVRAAGEKEIPPGSVVIVERGLAESFDATGRWKLVDENIVAAAGPGPGGFGPGGRGMGFRGGPGPGRGDGGDSARPPDAPSPQQRGKNQAQIERYAGMSPAERRTQVWADVAQWAAGKPIFWFSRSPDLLANALPAGAELRTVAEVDAPVMMGPGGGGPPGGMAGPGRGGRGGFGPPGGGPGGPGGRGGGFGPPGMAGARGGVAPAPEGGNKLRVVEVRLRKS